jgi:carbonic anhydrase/acetyltransferase-like protein (isoleucine patch superfamily)
MPIYELDGNRPDVPAAGQWWLAPDAHVIGKVKLADEVGIWFGVVVRGDNELITIGARTNIQEGAMLHTDPGLPMEIGADVTIGHHAIIHGCTIGAGSLIGMGATILNRAKIGKNCLVGANALVTERKEFPDGSLIMGSPARAVRALDEAAIEGLYASAASYVRNWRRFSSTLKLLPN